jgi:hypothetical protein
MFPRLKCTGLMSASPCHVHGWWVRLRVTYRGALSVGMRLSGYNTENIAVDYRGYRGWRLPPSLHDKDLFCRFRKSVAATKYYYFVSTQLSMLFQSQSKVVDSVDPFLPSFLCSLYILLNLILSWLLLKYCLINQLINTHYTLCSNHWLKYVYIWYISMLYCHNTITSKENYFVLDIFSYHCTNAIKLQHVNSLIRW